MTKSAVLLTEIQLEMGKFQSNAGAYVDKGNKAAAVRSRTSSKALAKMLKEWRKVTVAECRGE